MVTVLIFLLVADPVCDVYIPAGFVWVLVNDIP